jgi:tetratricopeptide (TPR) repeat protein
VARKKNAVERQVERLADQWNEFAEEAEPRLLRWLTESDSASLVIGFIEQQRAGDGEVPDLFLRFEIPFEQPDLYGGALVESFRQLYADLQADEDARPGLEAAGVKLDWRCPEARGASGVAAFAQACASFQRHYQNAFQHLAVALTPERISAAAEWEKWLLSLVRADLPPSVRVVVLDSATDPFLKGLAQAEPQRVRTVAVEADMNKVAQEAMREAGGEGPGVAFRRHFVELTNAKDKAGAGRSAEAALSIASEHGWLPLQVAVHVALGAAYQRSGDGALALDAYRKAGEVSKAAADKGDPTGPALIVQSRFAEGAALMSEGRFAEAARVYEEAAAAAADRKDHLMTLEGWRMAASCHEAAGAIEPSWACGGKALDVGAMLDDQVRPNSTLPFVGQGLLRLTKRQAYADRDREVRQRMTQLVGPDWEKKAEGAAP